MQCCLRGDKKELNKVSDGAQKLAKSGSTDLRCETIDHVRVFNNDEIQPAAASLPACGHPHLVTPGLQQLSYCLK